jgi:tetratricopeptide (TPR) repeat protein
MIRSQTPVALLLAALLGGCATSAPPDPGAVAAAYAEAGQYDAAAREIDLAVRSHPRDAALRRQAAAIHRSAGNVGKAVGQLEAAIRLTPSDHEVWVALGDLESDRDNTADAYVAYRRASELAPRDLRAVAGLALAAERLGFQEEAEAAYARWAALEKEAGEDTPHAPER